MRNANAYKNSVSSRIIKIAIVAIALGIVMILISIGTGVGLQKSIEQKMTSFSGHLYVTLFENNEITTIVPMDKNVINQELSTHSEKVKSFYPIITKGTLLKVNNEFEGVLVKGVDNTYSWSQLEKYLVKGRFPKIDKKLNGEILMSVSVASKLNLKIEEKVTAYFYNEKQNSIPNIRRFTVVGLYETNFPDFDNTYIFSDLRHLQRINKWKENEIGAMEIFINNFDKIEEIGNDLYTKFPSDFDLVTVKEKYKNFFDWISLFDFNILVILVMIILVGTLNMATALLALILERTRTIGILKAMGASNNLIQKIFLWNAFYIILKGLLIGNIIGLGLLWSQYQYKWLKLNPETYYASEVPVSLSFTHFVSLNLGILIICTLLLWIPSLVIGKIDPSEAIRKK